MFLSIAEPMCQVLRTHGGVSHRSHARSENRRFAQQRRHSARVRKRWELGSRKQDRVLRRNRFDSGHNSPFPEGIADCWRFHGDELAPSALAELSVALKFRLVGCARNLEQCARRVALTWECNCCVHVYRCELFNSSRLHVADRHPRDCVAESHCFDRQRRECKVSQLVNHFGFFLQSQAATCKLAIATNHAHLARSAADRHSRSS